MTPTVVHERHPAIWAVASLVVAVPLAAGNLTPFGIGSHALLYDGVALPRFVTMLVLTLAAWVLAWWGLSRDGRGITVDATWGLLAALGGWGIVSAAFSPHGWLGVLGQSERMEGVVTLVFYGLLYGLALQTLRSPRALRTVVACFVGAAGVLAVHGLVQYAGLERADYTVERFSFSTRIAFSTLGNANFLAALLVLALPCAVGLALTARSRTAGRSWWAFAAVVLLGLIATLTRGAWFAAVVEVSFAAALALRTGRKRRFAASGRKVVVIATVLALVAFAGAAIVLRPGAISGKIASPVGPLSRLGLAGIAFDAVRVHPLTGYGPDAFLAAFRAHYAGGSAGIPLSTTVNNAHSWPLQLVATLGLPGAALLVLAVCLALWRSRPVLGRGVAEGGRLATAVWVACLGFATAMLFNVATLASTVPFWLFLGALAAPHARRVVGVPRAAALAGGALSLALLAAAVLSSVTLLRADAAYLASRYAFNGLTRQDPVAEADTASALVPMSVKYARGAAQAQSGRTRAAIAAGAPAAEVRAHYLEAYARFERALRIDRQDYATLAWLSALQADTGLYLKDASLEAEARRTAQAASRLDVGRQDVRALAAGDLSASARLAAMTVPPLP